MGGTYTSYVGGKQKTFRRTATGGAEEIPGVPSPQQAAADAGVVVPHAQTMTPQVPGLAGPGGTSHGGMAAFPGASGVTRPTTLPGAQPGANGVTPQIRGAAPMATAGAGVAPTTAQAGVSGLQTSRAPVNGTSLPDGGFVAAFSANEWMPVRTAQDAAAALGRYGQLMQQHATGPDAEDWQSNYRTLAGQILRQYPQLMPQAQMSPDQVVAYYAQGGQAPAAAQGLQFGSLAPVGALDTGNAGTVMPGAVTQGGIAQNPALAGTLAEAPQAPQVPQPMAAAGGAPQVPGAQPAVPQVPGADLAGLLSQAQTGQGVDIQALNAAARGAQLPGGAGNAPTIGGLNTMLQAISAAPPNQQPGFGVVGSNGQAYSIPYPTAPGVTPGATQPQRAPTQALGYTQGASTPAGQNVVSTVSQGVNQLQSIVSQANTPDLQAVVAAQLGQTMAAIKQAQDAYMKQAQGMESQQDPAVMAALNELSQVVSDQRNTMVQELNDRGLLQSGILLTEENKLNQNQLTQAQKIIGGHLSQITSQILSSLASFTNEQTSTLRAFGTAGITAAEEQARLAQQQGQFGANLAERQREFNADQPFKEAQVTGQYTPGWNPSMGMPTTSAQAGVALESLSSMYFQAQKQGDQATMDWAHQTAQQIRAQFPGADQGHPGGYTQEQVNAYRPPTYPTVQEQGLQQKAAQAAAELGLRIDQFNAKMAQAAQFHADQMGVGWARLSLQQQSQAIAQEKAQTAQLIEVWKSSGSAPDGLQSLGVQPGDPYMGGTKTTNAATESATATALQQGSRAAALAWLQQHASDIAQYGGDLQAVQNAIYGQFPQ